MRAWTWRNSIEGLTRARSDQRRPWLVRPWAKPLVFGLCLLPLGWLVWGAAADALGPNPAEALIRGSGLWALRALCVALAVTPLRLLLRQPPLARLRRMLGLFAFFYASLHLLAYAWLDMGLEPGEMLRDLLQRPFILVGMAAWIVLLALAASSPGVVARWMGARRWRRLHRGVYLVAALAVLHFGWMRAGKNDFGEVWVYGLLLAGLLLARPLLRRRSA